MTVWFHLPTIIKWRRVLQIAGLLALCVAFVTTLIFASYAQAAPGINQTLSFQGRLLNSSGGVVPDGYYNIQFKIYQDGDGQTAGNTTGSPTGSLEWTENHINDGGTSGVKVTNGYFSATLGSKTAFGASIDWNQDTLWLSMNVAGTATACTTFGTSPCTADGEMLPMKRLTSVPYALNAGRVGGLAASDLIQNQNSAQQTASNFWISGTGRADTALQAPAIDTATATTLTIGATNASSVTIGKSDSTTLVQGSLQSNGSLIVKNSSDFSLIEANTDSNTVSLGQSVASNGVWFGSKDWGGGYTPYSGSLVLASRYQTGSSAGQTAQVTVRAIHGLDAPNNKFQVAIYADNAGTPGDLVAQTGVGVLDDPNNGYLSLAISANLSPNTQYWLAYMTNGNDPNNNNLIYEPGAGTSCYMTNSYSPVFPANLSSATCGGTNKYTIYVDFAGAPQPAMSIDGLGNVGIGITGPSHKLQVEGDALIRSSTNVSTAFQVQNAAGTSALTVNTSTNAVLVAGTLDTTTATSLSIGSANATNINIGSSGVNTIVAGNLQSAGLDTASAGTLTLGATNATAITLAQDVTVAAGRSLTLAGGNTASRPASPTEGMLYFDTTTHQMLQWNGSKWIGDKADSVIVAANDSSQADKDAADYVADGTGDQTEINAALTTAAGKKVVLLAGTYSANATITIPNNTTLAGVGSGSVIQLADIDATDNLIENSDTSTGTGVTITDLKLDGQDTLNTAGDQRGIFFNNMGDYAAGRAGSTIRNIQLSNFRSYGIFYNSSDNNTISGSTISGMDTGGATLGIYFESSSRNNSVNNNVFTTNSYAIRADGSGTTNNSIAQNIFRNNNYGIMLYGATNATISGNNFDTTTNLSVSIYSDSGTNGYHNVTGNSFRGDGVSISINNVSENTVSNNKILDSGNTTDNNAISIDGNSDRNNITGNSITDSSCTSTCYAITIKAAAADVNSVSSNSIGANGSINDVGTDTVYSNQMYNSTAGMIFNSSPNIATNLALHTQYASTVNNSTAFEVQNAAGTSALTVDTTTNTVLVAGTLDTTTATSLSIGTATATSINIGNASTNYTNTIAGNTVIKSATGGNSTTMFQLQRADGTAMLIADSSGQTITIGNVSGGNYTLVSSSTGAITKYGTARNTKKITLNAEYTGSVLDAGSGSNNTGTMTSSLDLTNRMNYYKWTTTQGSNQNYDVVVQVPLPNDFDGWASSNPLSITTRTSDTTNGTITLEARDSGGSVQCNFVSVTPGSTGTWTANNSACTLSAGTYTAGDYITLRIRMQAPNGGDTRIGNITLSYLSKY